MSVRVVTGSRLHFGLLNPSPAPLPRVFGGCGMMIDRPALVVTATPSSAWEATGPLADRALAVARALPDPPHPCSLVVEEAPPSHAGLGSGTQLALAVAAACSALWDRSVDASELASLTGRGRRSAVGVHGFARGGFLVDGGKAGEGVAPLLCRLPFPQDWRVVLAIPNASPGLAGGPEQEAIAALPPDEALTGALCRLLLLGVLPALAEVDLPAFGVALGEYNARAGELFAPAQGGTYSSPAVAALVDDFRRLGVAGAGQSSWGPCVFAVSEAGRAEWLAARIPGSLVVRGRDEGAAIHSIP